MITPANLRALAAARLQDAQVLLANQCYDGAAYICGYAVELSLKARICHTLQWAGYPETKSEFDYLASFRVHHLDVLLRLSGRAIAIKQGYAAEWSTVVGWSPEMRYKPVGHVSPAEARSFVQAVDVLLQRL